jgi:hypothetical protein
MVEIAPLLLFLVLAAFAMWYVWGENNRDRS